MHRTCWLAMVGLIEILENIGDARSAGVSTGADNTRRKEIIIPVDLTPPCSA